MKVIRKRRHKQPAKATQRNVRRRSYHSGRNLLIVVMTLCAVVLVGSVCALCFRFLSAEDTEIVTGEPSVIENQMTTSLILYNGDTSILSVDLPPDKLSKVEFVSSNPDVLTVDSGGRVDARRVGEAVVTARCKDFYGECTVKIKKAKKQTALKEYTTAYTANPDIVQKNKKDGSQSLYSITVNRRTNTVTVYTYDDKGDYVVPVRAMVCSCGEPTEDNITPTGNYSVYFKNRWHALFGDVYGQYITGFSGHYLFHSVPYKKTAENTLKSDEFNKLGENASQGCVRLMVSDAKWIYDNVGMNTPVKVIDKKSDSDPLGKPPVLRVDTSVKWDPTDPDSKNPYHMSFPSVTGAENITIEKDSEYSQDVIATDCCGNDISDKIKVTGNVITSKRGTYFVTYSVTDDLSKSASQTVTVTVE